MTKIIIADDHILFREGLRVILQSLEKYEVIAYVSNGVELIEAINNCLPDIVLLDIGMPIMDGVEAAEIIKRDFPSVKILVLSMYGDVASYNKMIKKGVDGFVLKESSSKEMEFALEEIVAGDSYFSQKLLKRIIYKHTNKVKEVDINANDISKREMDVLRLVCQGFTNAEIGKLIYITPRTVELHKEHLMKKTNCRNTTNLIIYAIKSKLVEISHD